jgi:hypothetical protein
MTGTEFLSLLRTLWCVQILIFLSVSGCISDQNIENKFEKAFVKYPSRMGEWNQDDPETRIILDKYKPRIYIAPDSYLPLNFYDDYIPQCIVRNTQNPGKELYPSLDRNLLNEIRFSTQVYLDYQVSPESALMFDDSSISPTVYGRVYTDVIKYDDNSINLIFLKYSLAFPFSGLPADTGFWKLLGSGIIGNPRGWHELDIHGAIHVILDEENMIPVGVILAQHNHHRVFLRGIDFDWPGDNHVSISFSQFSNEPYLLPVDEQTRTERTIGNPMHIEYLFGVNDDAPLTAGFDKIYSLKGGATEIAVKLELLPPDDALYTAWISMGDRLKIFGIWETWYMRGPPGIDFYTFPTLKNLGDLMTFWYVDPGDEQYFKLVKENIRSFDDFDITPVLAHQRKRLFPVLARMLKNSSSPN